MRNYVLIFLANSGPQPWSCHFCDELVFLDGDGTKGSKLVVHHDDEDRENSALTNLKPAHNGCHASYHAKQQLGKKRGSGPAISRALRGRPLVTAHRAKLSAALKGRPGNKWSDERREAFRETARAREAAKRKARQSA